MDEGKVFAFEKQMTQLSQRERVNSRVQKSRPQSSVGHESSMLSVNSEKEGQQPLIVSNDLERHASNDSESSSQDSDMFCEFPVVSHNSTEVGKQEKEK